ncbi:ureidoglycolate lyase [Paracoccus methylarcula]|uniref:Ureidoglycolate hydrolase n=1 Tax=Paracoccus methylarcula TaxID=72022 RepID=A0A3R7LHD0_9RHOB|nr:ureidoglycolate lyase [Paracoccus methylarcula]RNF34013.1 ureidoglycolate hydrolase [Paracoccus methylarcula]
MIPIELLTPDAFVPFGTALGFASRHTPDTAFFSTASDFWHEHGFVSGEAQTEILWVVYRNPELAITRLEAHTVTEQALIPLTGPIVHIVARSGPDGAPDPRTVKAFTIEPGQGIVMAKECWHATRVFSGDVTCAMLTRAATTRDLVAHLHADTPLAESHYADIDISIENTAER